MKATIQPLMIGVLLTVTNAEPAQQTVTARIEGQELTLRAKATRSELFGAIDIYSVGVYTASGVKGVDALRQPDVVKAVRVEVLYDGSMAGKVPPAWWEELVPALSEEQQQTLRAEFARLSSGDSVWITYAPTKGTKVQRGGRMVLSTSGGELMNAVLDLWLDSTPVAADVHATLVEQLNRGGG